MGNDESNNFIFSIFVDRIFTNLFEPLFTKLFDAAGADPGFPCVYHGCNGD